MLRVGIMLPSRETAMTGEHDARGLVDFAKTAEAAGFDSVWVGDSRR
jgi:alkanesulfonate monooxygenase SsuD/methylene tetrahydromethanopterin reductase-like flavin-dependent oxidoreductase (luciferase family)